MDAIAMLAREAANSSLEKQAGGFGSFLTSGMNTARKGFNLAKPLFSSGGRFSMGRSAATAAGAGLGAGAYNVATAPSAGEGSLGWHHQAIKGQDLGAGARGWGNMEAWRRAIASPVKSVASMFAGNGPDVTHSGVSTTGGQWGPADPKTGRQSLVGGQSSRTATFSPQAQGYRAQYDQLKKQYGDMETAHKAKIADLTKQRQGLPAGYDYRRFTPEQITQAQKLENDMSAAREALKSRHFGGSSGFLGIGGRPDAAQAYEQMQGLEGKMRDIGMLGQRAAARPGTSVPLMVGSPRRSSPDDIYDALRMSAYTP